MPYCYTTQSAMKGVGPYSTSSSALGEVDVYTQKPGSYGSFMIFTIRGQGRGAGLTALSGITLNVKYWTTASTGGTTLTPSPNDASNGVAALAVPAIATTATGQVTQGSGGGLYRGGFGFGASGPGGWAAATPDAALKATSQATAPSFDLYSVSGTASLLYEFWVEHQE